MYKVSFGLRASEKEDQTYPSFNDTEYQLAPFVRFDGDVEGLRKDFNRWIICNGFRDMIEAVQGTLNDTRFLCIILSTHNQGDLVNQQLIQDEFQKDSHKFEWMGLPDKFKFIKKTYSPDIIPPSEKYVLSINRVRNCLTHREGIVSPKDITDNNELKLVYDPMRVFSEGDDGEKIFLEGPPYKGPKGKSISIGRYEKVKSFKLGERISLSEQDYIEICLSLKFFCDDLLNCFNEYCNSLGWGKDKDETLSDENKVS